MPMYWIGLAAIGVNLLWDPDSYYWSITWGMPALPYQTENFG
jgi:hypothetical protein